MFGVLGHFFMPVAKLVGIILICLVLHHLFCYFSMARALRRIGYSVVALSVIALALLSIGFLSVTHVALRWPVWGPVLLVAGAGLLEYCASTVTNQIPAHPLARQLSQRSASLTRRGLLLALVLAGLLAATAQLAHDQGRQTAKAVAASLPTQFRVVVYSRLRLQISGSGVSIAELDGSGAAFSYRYEGMRLLAHAGGRWLIVPWGWTPATGDRVIMLSDSRPRRPS